MSSTVPLGKFLASSDKKTRDKAIQNLATFLSDPSRDTLPNLELAKLWKGIFYCFWMSDKPLVQQALASELAEILLSIHSISSSLNFLRGFWEATVREWNGIDRLRMDKYLMLIRRFLNASFRLLMRNNWDPAICAEYNEILTRKGAGPLCPDDIRVPAGLTYHLCDIYLEELDKASQNSSSPTPLFIILQPFIILAARTPTKTTYQRIQTTLIDPLFANLQLPSPTPTQYPTLLSNACISDPAKEGIMEKSLLRSTLLRQIFDVAGEQSTRDANRKRLYAVWKANTTDEDEMES